MRVANVRGTVRKLEERFDAVMASERIEVIEVEHCYEASVAAGSDHSYVYAHMMVPRRIPD